jgi:hypothetical protein
MGYEFSTKTKLTLLGAAALATGAACMPSSDQPLAGHEQASTGYTAKRATSTATPETAVAQAPSVEPTAQRAVAQAPSTRPAVVNVPYSRTHDVEPGQTTASGLLMKARSNPSSLAARQFPKEVDLSRLVPHQEAPVKLDTIQGFAGTRNLDMTYQDEGQLKVMNTTWSDHTDYNNRIFDRTREGFFEYDYKATKETTINAPEGMTRAALENLFNLFPGSKVTTTEGKDGKVIVRFECGNLIVNVIFPAVPNTPVPTPRPADTATPRPQDTATPKPQDTKTATPTKTPERHDNKNHNENHNDNTREKDSNAKCEIRTEGRRAIVNVVITDRQGRSFRYEITSNHYGKVEHETSSRENEVVFENLPIGRTNFHVRVVEVRNGEDKKVDVENDNCSVEFNENATATPVTPTATGTVPTATPTSTGVVVTATPTETGTPVVVTATPTNTGTPIIVTATPTETGTPVVVTATSTSTGTPIVVTATPTETPKVVTATPATPTETPVIVTPTNTSTPRPTITPQPVHPTATFASTVGPTETPRPIATAKPTFTAAPATATAAPTGTLRPTVGPSGR